MYSKLILALLVLVSAYAQANKPSVFNSGGVAINGYDPVAYFTESQPVPGKAEASHQLQWQGVTWQFASLENRAQFEQDPHSYAPQYGGYCAYAVANNYTASTDPDAWSIHEGKLYLNFNRGVRFLWARDIPGHVEAGDANWPQVLSR